MTHDAAESPDTPGGAGAEHVPTPEEVAAELVAAGVQEPGTEGEVRRYPSTIGGALYLCVLAATFVGLGVVATGHWRGGVHIVAGALVAAAGMRLVLPARDAGMLAVRNRFLDATLLTAVGVALWLLASTIPEQTV